MKKLYPRKFFSALFVMLFILLSLSTYAYDRELAPWNLSYFGSIQQNANGSISFTLIVNNDQECNDFWDWFAIEAILPDNSRTNVLEGNNDFLHGHNFMVDDPNDDINMYFRTNYHISLDHIWDRDGGDLHVRLTWHNPPKLKRNGNLVLKGRWTACGNDWVGEWKGDEWMRTVHQIYNQITPKPGTKLGILQHFAPRVYHDTRDDNVCMGGEVFGNCIGYRYKFYQQQDMISKVDFDNDWNSKNNWESNCYGFNGGPIAPRAYAYSSFVETETHYFLGYHYFHPTDDAEIPEDRHENDMEDVYVCIRKTGGFGTFEGMLTQAHGDYSAYRSNDLHFTMAHPHIWITSNGTGLGEWSGVLGVDDHGHGIYKYTKSANGDFAGDDGIIYNIADEGDIPGYCRKYHDGTYPQYNYALVDINELWNRRHDTSNHPFMAYNDFGGEGSDEKGPGAHTPWRLQEFTNPAAKFLEYFPELDDNKPWSRTYLHNPYFKAPQDTEIELRRKLPYGWQSKNIGSPSKVGLTFFTNGTFTMDGAGTDIWSTSDQFNFAYTNLTGDGEIVARVYSIQDNIHEWSKAAIMIRETDVADSKHVTVAASSNTNGTFMARNANGAHTNDVFFPNGSPIWLKLLRRGNTFSGYYSNNGVNWNHIGNKDVSMNNNVLIGLAVSSHDPNWFCSATFDNVSINGENLAQRNMLAYYPFNNNANDESGNNHHASSQGTQPHPDRLGNANCAYTFDGIDDHIVVPNLNPKEITINAWAKFEGNGFWERIVDFGQGNNAYNILFARIGTSGDLAFENYRTGSDRDQAVVKNGIRQGQYAMYSATIDASGLMRIYINGEMQAQTQGQKIANAIRNKNYIGKSNWPDPHFKGKMDEVRIYDIALNSHQIAELYTNTIHKKNAIKGNQPTTNLKETEPQKLLKNDEVKFYSVNNEIIIETSENIANKSNFSIYDLTGRTLLTTKLKKAVRHSISAPKSELRVYIVKLITKEGKIYTEKLILK